MAQIDEQIIEQCQRGDKNAFRIVVQTYQRLVFSIALKMLCNEDAAKDIVQETFIRIWQNIRNFERGRNFQTWIYTIASRLCLDALEKEHRLDPMPEDEACFQDFADEKSPQRMLENKELISVIKTLTSRLSDKQRIVFTLVYLENLETKEVEKITGMDADKIKSNLYVARKTIKEQLKQLGYE